MILEEELKIGSTGDNVKILQEKLKLLNLYNPVITGSFGKATELGVKEFQKRYGLKETGIVDTNTWNLLFEKTENTRFYRITYPNLSYGSSGNDVSELQKKLNVLLYYTKAITGKYDKETELAVKRFQYNNGLTATGTTTNETWKKINELYGNLNNCVIKEEITNNYYTVVSGDTLYSIARKFNTTVDEIKRLNNLTSNSLTVGQRLLIKEENNNENMEEIYYTVVRGDTLYSIARKFNTTVDEIKRLNNLTTNTLIVGQKLLVNTKGNAIENFIYYTVARGDTLYSIASRFNTTVDTIKSINNLTTNTLAIGQVLTIPSTSNYSYYTVLRGDTLYSIARKFNTTVDTIKSINNLTTNILSVGQTLRIPI